MATRTAGEALSGMRYALGSVYSADKEKTLIFCYLLWLLIFAAGTAVVETWKRFPRLSPGPIWRSVLTTGSLVGVSLQALLFVMYLASFRGASSFSDKLHIFTHYARVDTCVWLGVLVMCPVG